MVITNVTCDCKFLQDIPLKAPGRSRQLFKGTTLADGCECTIQKNGKRKKIKNINTVQLNAEKIDPTAPIGNFNG